MPNDATPHCDGHDPELWFRKGDAPQAKAICLGCPERARCLESAINAEVSDYMSRLSEDREHTKVNVFGVWGGLDADQRRGLVLDRITERRAA